MPDAGRREQHRGALTQEDIKSLDLASERTMYRLLASEHGGVRERRAQLEHPPCAAPELLAERPHEVYSWDISKLKGPATWTYFYLYVILDVFNRYAVDWTVQHRECGVVADELGRSAPTHQRHGARGVDASDDAGPAAGRRRNVDAGAQASSKLCAGLWCWWGAVWLRSGLLSLWSSPF